MWFVHSSASFLRKDQLTPSGAKVGLDVLNFEREAARRLFKCDLRYILIVDVVGDETDARKTKTLIINVQVDVVGGIDRHVTNGAFRAHKCTTTITRDTTLDADSIAARSAAFAHTLVVVFDVAGSRWLFASISCTRIACCNVPGTIDALIAASRQKWRFFGFLRFTHRL